MHGCTTLTLDTVEVLETTFSAPQVPSRSTVRFNIDPSLGLLKLNNIHHRYFAVSDTYAEFTNNTLMIPPKERYPHFGLAMMNSESGTVKFEDGQWTDVYHGEAYFTFNPGVDEVHRFVANRPMRVNFLSVDYNYLSQIIAGFQPSKDSDLFHVRESVLNNKFVGVGAKIQVSAFQNIVTNMFRCPLEGTLGNLALEGNLQQLLALYLGNLDREQPKEPGINSRDREIMVAVKEHLDATFNEDHTLLDLSRKFGINQNKLKTRFRETFGVPVIGYLYNLKMEHARMLLLDKGMFVSEVSSVVGYRNANHFATAFKRKFGINPSKLKG